MTDLALFDQVGEIIRGSTPPTLGLPHVQVRHNGVKAWFGDPAPQREHYEAQIIAADLAPGARSHAVEIGFHAEHRDETANEAALTSLLTTEPRWRAELGDDAVPGRFLGRGTWRRISETWLDIELDGPEVPFEIGVRLVDYIRALEPHRRGV
ncbi:hypothetical protein [Actinomadura chokoriensis]|uniref:Uncharacterized protein n=1 Tax=Actinomadura chokoriensis TaxID=454156 RepID=A0ABV4R8Z7_9ACTN